MDLKSSKFEVFDVLMLYKDYGHCSSVLSLKLVESATMENVDQKNAERTLEALAENRSGQPQPPHITTSYNNFIISSFTFFSFVSFCHFNRRIGI